MENKLNIQELKHYSKECARKMAANYFKDGKTEIHGSDILTFSSVDQINYFILKIVFFQWKDETAKIFNSPYFDYNHTDVHDAIQQLANVLSNHIRMNGYHFEVILADAIEESIYLSLSPYHYFRQYYFSPGKVKVTLDELKEKSKYLKINKLFFQHFIEKLETYRINNFQVADIMGYFQEAYYHTNDTFDSHEPIVEKLTQIVPFELHKIVSDLKRKDDYAPTPLEVFESKKANQQKPEPTPANDSKPMPIVGLKPQVEIKLNLNQRVMFLKHLFQNDVDQMNHTMARLETCSSHHDANYILGFNNWDKNNEVVQEFYELVQAKFK